MLCGHVPLTYDLLLNVILYPKTKVSALAIILWLYLFQSFYPPLRVQQIVVVPRGVSDVIFVKASFQFTLSLLYQKIINNASQIVIDLLWRFWLWIYRVSSSLVLILWAFIIYFYCLGIRTWVRLNFHGKLNIFAQSY